jgi:hypothetical protein
MSAVVGLVALVVAIAIGTAWCSASKDDDGDGVGDGDDRSAETGTGSAADAEDDDVAEPDLRAELVALQGEDQAERLGESGGNGDYDRTERLREILDGHGWPTHDLVGEDGSTAAWVIAQHSDLDVEFQERTFELMEAAVAEDQADASELAYLEDRIAVNTTQPQRYGTQVRCAADAAAAAEAAENP